MFKKIFLLLFLLIIPAFADYKAEISYLLNYVKETKCTYIRNGSTHTGKEAEKHIKAKYEHYKDEIHSAEDFIRLSASKSMMTGKKYYIQCPGEMKMQSQKWLLQELQVYRSK